MHVETIDRYLLPPDQVATWRRDLLPGPHDESRWQNRLDTLFSESFDRQALACELANYNRCLDIDPRAAANAERLADPASVAIVTGQQAGLFTGPLYTIHKAITTIRLAAEREAALGVPVVPIFWNATEDHDLSEIAEARFPGHSWRANFPAKGLAAEALRTRPAVVQVVQEYLQTLAPVQHRDEIAELLDPTFTHYGLWTSAVLARLFRGTGLVVLEPRLLRRAAASLMVRVLDDRDGLRQALREGANQLASHELEPSFTTDNSFGLFHIDEAGHRRRLLERDGKLLVQDEWLPAEEVEQLLADHPERFSTAAYLRPIVQNATIPTLAYVGGPGEFRYHLQLPPLFAHLGISMPILHLRNHATILGPNEQKLAAQLDLQPADYFRRPEDFHHAVGLPEPVADAFAKADTDLHQTVAELEAAIDLSLDSRRYRGYEARWRKELQQLRHKIRREYQRAAGIDNGRIDRFFATVHPRRQPQDRQLNVFPFIQVFGPGFIQQLLDQLDPYEDRHLIIYA